MLIIYVILAILYYTAMPIGETGSGKSLFGCNFIDDSKAFTYGRSPHSITCKTIAKSKTINGDQFYFIDNAGFYTTQGNDKKNIEEMLLYLKNWTKGINAFFITINVQNQRFDTNLQMMLKIINYFFNNSQLWTQTAIVFTKCFRGTYDKKEIERDYKKCVVDFIKSLPGCDNLNLKMKCFFVDSEKYSSDKQTQKEYQKIRDFSKKFNPVSTQNLASINPKYMMKVKRKIDRKQVNEKIQNIEDNNEIIKRTFFYENLTQAIITDWNGKTIFKNPKVVGNWTEYQIEEYEYFYNQRINTEFKGSGEEEMKLDYIEDRKRSKISFPNGTFSYGLNITINQRIEHTLAKVTYENSTVEIKKDSSTVYKEEGLLKSIFSKEKTIDYINITRTFQDMQRKVIISPIGNKSYGKWYKVGKEYTKSEIDYSSFYVVSHNEKSEKTFSISRIIFTIVCTIFLSIKYLF